MSILIKRATHSDLGDILPIQRQVQELHVSLEPERYKPVNDAALRAYLSDCISSQAKLVLVARGTPVRGYFSCQQYRPPKVP